MKRHNPERRQFAGLSYRKIGKGKCIRDLRHEDAESTDERSERKECVLSSIHLQLSAD